MPTQGGPHFEVPPGPRWDQRGVPQRGWVCIEVTDLEEATHTCEMCGKEEIRYVHTCAHPNYPRRLDVGCVCVERMTGDYIGPKQREAKLRGRAARRAKWLDRQWRHSWKGGQYMNLRNGPNVGVFPCRFGSGWKYRVGRNFSPDSYRDDDEAKLALFDALYPVVVRVNQGQVSRPS